MTCWRLVFPVCALAYAACASPLQRPATIQPGTGRPPITDKAHPSRVGVAFGTGRAFVSMTSVEAGRERHRLTALRRDGTIEAAVEGDEWDLPVGCAATGASLLVPTDEGIVRFDVANGRIDKTREFPETEPFVDRDARLLIGKDGLIVVTRSEIRQLRIG